MDRRRFLSTAGVFAGCIGIAPARASDGGALVIVELDGGNDGLNTVIPIADARYRELRPTLVIAPRDALTLDSRTALHPSLRAAMPLWQAGELAIVHGVGHAGAQRSHFRSRQIWHTASGADEYRDDAWLDLRALNDGRSFIDSCKAAAHAIATQNARMIRLVLHGFDTHENQAPRHASLLGQLADGLATLRHALMQSGHWHRTFVMTRSEFGRSARENVSGGTDHGAASVQFVTGGAVRGGIHGASPRLDRLDDVGALAVTTDFRRLYATAIAACSLASSRCGGFDPLPILAA